MVIPKTSDLLKLHKLVPNKRLGQNFILDSNITDKIVRYIPNIDNAVVLEIGAGPGTLTRSLLTSSAKTIYALECDPKLITLLNILQGLYFDRLKIIESDALYFLEESIDLCKKITLVGNLPYNISVPLLFKWLCKTHLFDSLTLMFQKEVADRITAKPNNKNYGILSVMVQFSCCAFHNFDVNPKVFFPPPKITSSVITLIPKAIGDYPAHLRSTLKKICDAAFNQRRKILYNSLSKMTTYSKLLLDHTGIDGNLRAENLSVEQFTRLAAAYEKLNLID